MALYAGSIGAVSKGGTPFGVAIGVASGIGHAVLSGVLGNLAVATAATAVQLLFREGTPVSLTTLMHDAHLRVLLRVTGPAYEFRHARLQEWLARRRSDQPGAASFTGSRLSWAARPCGRPGARSLEEVGHPRSRPPAAPVAAVAAPKVTHRRPVNRSTGRLPSTPPGSSWTPRPPTWCTRTPPALGPPPTSSPTSRRRSPQTVCRRWRRARRGRNCARPASPASARPSPDVPTAQPAPRPDRFLRLRRLETSPVRRGPRPGCHLPGPTPASRSPATPAASGCASTSTAASVHRRHRAGARSVLRHRAAHRRSRRLHRGPGSVSLVSGPFELARDCSYAFVARPIGMADFSARQSSSGNGSPMGHPRHIRTCDVL